MTTPDTTAALILKAARRYDEDSRDTRYKGLVARTRLAAFAEVASDILGITMVPFVFEHSVRQALAAQPLPNNLCVGRSEGERNRAEWEAAFLAAFVAEAAKLGNTVEVTA